MTPAILLLKQHAIAFTTHAYEHQSNTRNYGLEAANALNLSIYQVFKTLVCQLISMELVVAVLPVAAQLNLKHLAQAAEVKKAQLAPPKQVHATTGYLLGGVSPLAQKKQLRTFIDATAQSYDTIFISAGQRGLEIEIAPKDLGCVTQARFVSLGNIK
jgi:Cys-tRNA(Pro)/Cys-tRNA(Cys) deacylase